MKGPEEEQGEKEMSRVGEVWARGWESLQKPDTLRCSARQQLWARTPTASLQGADQRTGGAGPCGPCPLCMASGQVLVIPPQPSDSDPLKEALWMGRGGAGLTARAVDSREEARRGAFQMVE